MQDIATKCARGNDSKCYKFGEEDVFLYHVVVMELRWKVQSYGPRLVNVYINLDWQEIRSSITIITS